MSPQFTNRTQSAALHSCALYPKPCITALRCNSVRNSGTFWNFPSCRTVAEGVCTAVCHVRIVPSTVAALTGQTVGESTLARAKRECVCAGSGRVGVCVPKQTDPSLRTGACAHPMVTVQWRHVFHHIGQCTCVCERYPRYRAQLRNWQGHRRQQSRFCAAGLHIHTSTGKAPRARTPSTDRHFALLCAPLLVTTNPTVCVCGIPERSQSVLQRPP